MPMIRETIVTTLAADGRVHIAPIGLIQDAERPAGDGWIIAPFKPSATLENLRRSGQAVANYTDDVMVFAGCLTGLRDWPTKPAEAIEGAVLEAALSHAELTVERIEEDELRPRFHCRVVHEASHAPFRGFNRAQAAVIEAAILVSRLHMLSDAKIDGEIAYLRIAIDKTAGPREREAWERLMARVAAHRAEGLRKAGA